MQDRDGDMGPYATWWSSHFYFFNVQEDKISQYNTWKELELKLHHKYCTEPTKFDIHHYAMKYEAAKTTYKLKLLIERQTSPLSPPKDAPPCKDGFFHPSLVERPQAPTTTSHFRKAAGHITQSAASSVVNHSMPSANTTMMEIWQPNFPMASQPG